MLSVKMPQLLTIDISENDLIFTDQRVCYCHYSDSVGCLPSVSNTPYRLQNNAVAIILYYLSQLLRINLLFNLLFSRKIKYLCYFFNYSCYSLKSRIYR